MHCVDLGESFQTHIYLQILASIQPRTSPVKFARSTFENVSPRGKGVVPEVLGVEPKVPLSLGDLGVEVRKAAPELRLDPLPVHGLEEPELADGQQRELRSLCFFELRVRTR